MGSNKLSRLKGYASGLRQLSIKKDRNFKRFLLDVQKAKSLGEAITLAFLCCPDYSYKVSNSGWGTYTHEKLGFGPGMMVLAYGKAFLDLTRFLRKEGLKVNLLLYFGDNESYDQAILGRLKITTLEFRRRLRCTMSSARLHVKGLLLDFSLDHADIAVLPLDMQDVFYNEKILDLVDKKLLKLSSENVKEVALKRKAVIKSLYSLDFRKDRAAFLTKVREQIRDRVVVGTGLSRERERGKLVSIVTTTPPYLIQYFNMENKKIIPVLTL